MSGPSGFLGWVAGPAGGTILTVCALALGVILGELDGWKRGARAERAEARGRQAARRFRAMPHVPAHVAPPLTLAPMPQIENRRRAERRTSIAAFLDPPDGMCPPPGHPGWDTHEASALAVANDEPDFLDQLHADGDELMARMHADVEAFLASLP